jgi:hypothetical protein
MDHDPARGCAGGFVMRRGAVALGFALLAPLASHGAELPLGRLFFTPEQRAALEEARRKNIRAEELAVSASKPKAPPPRDVVVNGLLMRSDGMSVIWVNGKAVENQTRDGLRVSPTASRESVVLRDPAKGRALRLKVGQRADLLSGRVEENYEARRAAARAEAAAAEAEVAAADIDKTADRRTRRRRAAPEDAPPALPSQGSASGESTPTRPTQPGPAPEATAATASGGDTSQ